MAKSWSPHIYLTKIRQEPPKRPVTGLLSSDAEGMFLLAIEWRGGDTLYP